MTANTVSCAVLAHERGLAVLLLATVLESTPALGRPPSRGFVGAVLTGSLKREVVATDAQRFTTFGVLEKLRSRDVLDMVDSLVARGLLELTGRTSLVCTSRGRSLLENEAQTRIIQDPLGIFPGAVSGVRIEAAIRSGLVDALRRYRMDRARAEDVPEYRVFSEATLRELATRLPNEQELPETPGMGPKRVASQGADILRILGEHRATIDRLVNDARDEAHEQGIPALATPASRSD